MRLNVGQRKLALTAAQLAKQFTDKSACRAYLSMSRGPDGVSSPYCANQFFSNDRFRARHAGGRDPELTRATGR